MSSQFESGLGTNEWHVPKELLTRTSIFLQDDGNEKLLEILNSHSVVSLDDLTRVRQDMLEWVFGSITEAGLMGTSTPDVYGQVIALDEEGIESAIHTVSVATAAFQTLIATYRRGEMPIMRQLGGQ